MSNKWKIVIAVFIILVTCGLYFFYTPVDIKPAILGKKISKENYEKGAVLLEKMQLAYGGKEKWLAYKTAEYVQEVDWYGDKLGISGWDELPQQFQMTSILGTDNSEFTLLTGSKKGQSWGVENFEYYKKTITVKKNIYLPMFTNKSYYIKITGFNFLFASAKHPSSPMQVKVKSMAKPMICYTSRGKANKPIVNMTNM